MVAPPAYAPVANLSINAYPYSPRSGPPSPNPLIGLGMSALDEKRVLAQAEMQANLLQAELEKRRQRGGADGDEEHSRAKVLATVGFYLVAAIVMVFANKWVLNAVSIPLTFLFFQLVLAVLLLHIASFLGYFTLPTLSISTMVALAPLIGINVVGLTFNTYCLQYVDASFYQVARGLILPFTVLASYLLLSSRPSAGVLAAVGIVCLGFFSGVSAEHLTVSPLGVMLGVFSSITTSLHAIVVKRSLGITSSPMDLAYYNNLLSAIALLPPLLLSGESATFTALVVDGGEALRTFVIGAVITGVFGFLICIAGFLSIKVTSPVTHMISSAVRGVIQTLLGVMIFSDVVTLGRASGIAFILFGSLLYTWVKDRESTRAARERREKEEREAEGRIFLDGMLSPGMNGGSSGLTSPVLPNSPGLGEFDEKRGEKPKVY